MKNLVEAFIDHLAQALEIADQTELSAPKNEIHNVLILGMGGSGIGGSIAAQVLEKEISVPVLSCKDYTIPSFVGENTLIIASSFSGNTEETLAALDEAKARTKNIVCLSSGGRISEMAVEEGFGLVSIPGGMPPRAALGYSFPQLFSILKQCSLINWDIRNEFEPCIELIRNETDSIRKQALDIAQKIHNRTSIIYAESGFEGVCIRFRQQINENSKKLCWHHVVPEMNHNELVGWREDASDKAVLILRNESDLPRNQRRIELSKEIFTEYNPEIIEIWSKGMNKLQRTLYLIHLCDWISVEIADINQTDSIEIKVIDYFKSELAKS